MTHGKGYEAVLVRRRIQSNYQINGKTVYTDIRFTPSDEFPYIGAYIIRNDDGTTSEGVVPLPTKSLEEAEEKALDHAFSYLQQQGGFR